MGKETVGQNSTREINYNEPDADWIIAFKEVLGLPSEFVIPEVRPQTMHETAIFRLHYDDPSSVPGQEVIVNITRYRRDWGPMSQPYFRVHIRQVSENQQKVMTYENVSKITINPESQSVQFFGAPKGTDPQRPLAELFNSGRVESLQAT